MPIYEYECRKCKAHQEVMQKISDKPLTKCAKCGGQLEKQWSNTSFQFKGSGWYVTDYAGKKADGASATAESESKKSAEASEKSAGESKTGDTSAAESATKETKESKSTEKEKPAAKKANNSKSTATRGSSTNGD